MKRVKSLVGFSVLSLVVLMLPSLASAQWGGDDDYNNNGRYGNNYNNLRGVAQSLRERARNFERNAERYDDRRDDRGGYGRNGGYGQYSGGGRNIKNLAGDFKDAADDFANAYGRGRNLSNSADEARQLLDLGQRIDQELYNSRGNRRLEREWSQIRNDLRLISDTYGYNNYGNRNRNRNGNWRNNIPFPLPF